MNLYSKNKSNTEFNFRRKKITMRQLLPYLYILPTMIFLAVFILKPFCFAIVKSFYNYDAATIDEFIGLKNYYRMFFEDEIFRESLKNFVVFFIGLIFAFAMPVMVAELVFNIKSRRLQTVYRTMFVMPMVIPLVVTVLVWKFMYYPRIGVFSKILESLSLPQINFLGNAALVKPSIIFIGFPWVSGLNLLVTFAALQGIDSSVLEASRIDGASIFRRVLYIDLPIIKSQLKTLFVLAVIGLVQDYEKVFILTQGGPNNASMVPGLRMYFAAFAPGGGTAQFGYSCAIAVVLFLITLLISVFTLNKRKEG